MTKNSHPMSRTSSKIKIARYLLLLFLVACTTRYYGYTRDQWQGMTPFEQEKAKVEWREIIAAKEQGTLGDPRSDISGGFVDYSENSNDSKE